MESLYGQLKELRQRLASRHGVCLKKPYDTSEAATSFAETNRKITGTKARCYLCWCGAWHLTTKFPTKEGNSGHRHS